MKKRERNYQLTDFEINQLVELQQALLPHVCPHCQGMTVVARNIMKSGLGGDFYEFTRPGDGKWGFFLGDATGHGLSAAAVAAVTYGMLHHVSNELIAPFEVMSEINRSLFSLNNRVGSLSLPFSSTAFYGVYDVRNGTFTYVNAGHPGALLLDPAKKEITMLDHTGLPIGFGEMWDGEEVLLSSVHNKKLIMFTDGILRGKQENGFALSELRVFVESRVGTKLEELIDAILNEAKKLYKNKFSDDVTLIGIDFSNVTSVGKCPVKKHTGKDI